MGTGNKTSWPRRVIRGSVRFPCLGQVGDLADELITS